MPADLYANLRTELERKKEELTIRLDRITANLRRGYHADSKERAKELEDSEVVDALGGDAIELQELKAHARARSGIDPPPDDLRGGQQGHISARQVELELELIVALGRQFAARQHASRPLDRARDVALDA